MIALEFWVLVVSLACMFLFSLCISQMASLPQASFNSKLPQSQSMPESHLNSTCLGICALGAKVVIRVQLYIHLIFQEQVAAWPQLLLSWSYPWKSLNALNSGMHNYWVWEAHDL